MTLRKLFDDQRDDEADQSQSLAECRAHDEDGEHAALDLRLTGHCPGSTQSGKADSKTSADNTETVTDNSHDSSFVVRDLFTQDNQFAMNCRRSVGTGAERYTEVPYLGAGDYSSSATSSASETYTAVRTVKT